MQDGMFENARPEVEMGRDFGEPGIIQISNLYVKLDPQDGDEVAETYTAFLYQPTDDMENGPFTEPEEIVKGHGAVPFKLTLRQAIELRDELNLRIK